MQSKSVQTNAVWYFNQSNENDLGQWVLEPKKGRKFVRLNDSEETLALLESIPLDESVELTMHFAEVKTNAGGKAPVRLPLGQYLYRPHRYPQDEALIPYSLRQEHFCEEVSRVISVEEDIRYFLNARKIYDDLGFLWRRGYLLFGAPGNGKTSLIRQLIQNHLPKETIAIWLGRHTPDEEFVRALEAEAKQGTLIVFIFEEIASSINDKTLSEFLEFLDGENSFSGSLFFATTNSIENLPNNMKNRPSRFDLVIEIDAPDKKDRYAILKMFLKSEPSEDYVTATEGMTIAHLKEVVLLHRVKGINFLEAAQMIHANRRLAKMDFVKRKDIGMGMGSSVGK